MRVIWDVSGEHIVGVQNTSGETCQEALSVGQEENGGQGGWSNLGCILKVKRMG